VPSSATESAAANSTAPAGRVAGRSVCPAPIRRDDTTALTARVQPRVRPSVRRRGLERRAVAEPAPRRERVLESPGRSSAADAARAARSVTPTSSPELSVGSADTDAAPTPRSPRPEAPRVRARPGGATAVTIAAIVVAVTPRSARSAAPTTRLGRTASNGAAMLAERAQPQERRTRTDPLGRSDARRRRAGAREVFAVRTRPDGQFRRWPRRSARSGPRSRDASGGLRSTPRRLDQPRARAAEATVTQSSIPTRRTEPSGDHWARAPERVLARPRPLPARAVTFARHRGVGP
jgi:hypothetical protein